MPTHEEEERFWREFNQLPPDRQKLFLDVLQAFVEDAERRMYRPTLRVKRVQGHPGVWEMTWALDGRATFHYGDDRPRGITHVVWRRIGSHDILRDP